MKKKVDSQTTAEDLPGFLDDAAIPDLAADSDGDAIEGDGVEDLADDRVDDHAAEPDAAEPGNEVSGGRAARPARARGAGGGAAVALGALLGAAGIGLGLAHAAGAVPSLAQYGLDPAALLVLGAGAIGFGSMRSRIGALEAQIDAGAAASEHTSVHAGLQYLIEAHRAHEERAPAAGEELQHVLLSLQRQDEKLANLTKAIKMYGKPLMEISGQAAEILAGLGQVRSAADSSAEALRAGFERVDARLQAPGAVEAGLRELEAAVGKLAAGMEQLAKKPASTLSLEPVQQHVTRVEVAVQALAQRLEDTEVRRSLVRLEDSAKQAHQELQQLLRGDGLRSATEHLQKTIDGTSARVLEGIGKLREGQLGGLENSVKDIQREVAGVATVLQQVQTALRNGARTNAPTAPAPAAGPTAGPAPAAPTAATAPAAPTGGPGANTPKAPTPAGAPAAAYATGAHKASGKNVLGAIAKLKQMKS